MNKVVIVTGAAAGLGAAIAEGFAKQAARLVITDRNEDKLMKVSEICKKYTKNKPLIVTADLIEDCESPKKIVDCTIKKFGQIDVLVNNAGILGMTSILDKQLMDVFDRVIATNLRAAVHMTHLAAPHLIKTKGNIVNVTSIAGLIPLSEKFCTYGTAKAGLNHFTKCVAFELAPKGVRVNNVNPGPVKTELFGPHMTEEEEKNFWDAVIKGTPMLQVPHSKDVANLVLFLASDKAKCITGASHVIDCGTVLKGHSPF